MIKSRHKLFVLMVFLISTSDINAGENQALVDEDAQRILRLHAVFCDSFSKKVSGAKEKVDWVNIVKENDREMIEIIKLSAGIPNGPRELAKAFIGDLVVGHQQSELRWFLCTHSYSIRGVPYAEGTPEEKFAKQLIQLTLRRLVEDIEFRRFYYKSAIWSNIIPGHLSADRREKYNETWDVTLWRFNAGRVSQELVDLIIAERNIEDTDSLRFWNAYLKYATIRMVFGLAPIPIPHDESLDEVLNVPRLAGFEGWIKGMDNEVYAKHLRIDEAAWCWYYDPTVQADNKLILPKDQWISFPRIPLSNWPEDMPMIIPEVVW